MDFISGRCDEEHEEIQVNRDELITKMLDAFYCAGIFSASTFPYSEQMRQGMNRALIEAEATYKSTRRTK